MENYDWSKFTKRISIKTDKSTIYTSWITQENLEKWFLSSAQFSSSNGVKKDRFTKVEPGDKYIWMWHGSDFVEEGEILVTNHLNFLKFTFLGCVVSISIKEEAGENVVELIQSEIPIDEATKVSHYFGCAGGWTFFLTNLKSILEGGIDLRNRNKELIDVINS